MAGKPPGRARPPSRATYQPSSASEHPRPPSEPSPPPTRPGTHVVSASEVRAERARPAAPAPAPAPAPRGEPVDLRGASTGRGLKLDAAAPGPAAGPGSEPDDGLSPFQRFAPSADQLGGAAEARSGDSLQVMAIVGGLLFMVGAAAVVSVLVIGVGWWTMGDMIEDGALAGLGDDLAHIGDTDVPEEILKKTPVGSKPKPGAAAPAGEEAAEPEATGPVTGNGTIILLQDKLFHSMEVNCPTSGIRTRANFRGGKATAYGLPTTEDCTVTFQGSEPAKATLRGNQTKACTFNPTQCLLQ